MHPTLELRNYKCHSISSLTVIEYSSELQRLLSDCASAQAGRSLCWSNIPHCWKSHVAAQYFYQSFYFLQNIFPVIFANEVTRTFKVVAKMYFYLSYDVTSGSLIRPCNEIDRPLVFF